MLELLKKAESTELEDKCRIYFSQLKPLMEHIRKHVDDLESKMPDEMWVLPKYKEMLFIC
jgi:glutamine synthetase